MDLSTLDTLLKSHVAQLQGLYDKLGAASDVVPTKLAELHSALVGTVEQQRQSAEHEVRQVKDSIHGLEATIARKQSQLSGEKISTTSTARASSSTTAAETLLQRRERLEKQEVALERDIQIREKQILEATAQLESYRPILGDFLDSPSDEASLHNDGTSLSLARLAALEAKIQQCKQETIKREQAFHTLLQEILEFWNELGISPSEQSKALLSGDNASASTELDFDMAILRTSQGLAEASDSARPRGSEQANKTVLRPDLTTIQLLSNKRAALEIEREKRMQRIQDLYDQLYPLWSRLGVSDDEADDFVEVWKGCEHRCIEAYEAELERMQQVKAENMAMFIQREREDIINLWDELYYSEDERASFDLLHCENYNEEVLLAHEIEKQRLLDEKHSKGPILDKLAKYFGLLDEMRQLEESANDPSRLTGRGQRGDPGRLLREEKQRKRVAKEKPKLEADLLRSIPDWEASHDQAFLVSGSRLLDDLLSTVESDQAARPPSRRAKTPVQGSTSVAKPSQSVQAAKRAHQPPVSASNAAGIGGMNAKRTKLSASTAPSTASRPPSTLNRYGGLGAIPATPCPVQPASSTGARRQQLMLVASEARLIDANQPNNQTQTLGHSKLPLKSAQPSHRHFQSAAWHSVGIGQSKAPLTSQSFFSPTAQPIAQQSHRSAFRPRPSTASTGTAYSSVPSASVFSGRSSRIASVATTASFGSDGRN